MTLDPILPQLWEILAAWRGYTYGPLSDADRTIDCSALTASILRAAYGPETIDRGVWRAMQVLDPQTGEVAHRRPWIPVEAVAEAVGEIPAHPHTGPYRPMVGRVHLCQGWKHLTTEGIGPGSRGHAWLWLSYGGWSGVCIESSQTGPRIWDGLGRRPLAQVITEDGSAGPMQPIDWRARAEVWTSGVAYVALP